MSDPRSILQRKFALEHRYANFGPVLMQMHVKGFRCHSNTLIDITSPITAFCGLNGTGKSTLLQLAAASYVYDTMRQNTVSYATRKRSVVRVQRGTSQYSEAHMGYGEARSQYLIQTIESLPPHSLVLIEEPEISLHSHAQHEFGCYLLNVSSRNGHQVLLTTHSEPLLAALPSESRVYLHAGTEGSEVIRGLTATEAKSLMANGLEKALHVLVEDRVASAILAELIRRVDATLLSTIGIYVAGGASEISAAVRTVGATGLPVAGVLDGDRAANPRENIFKLPGTGAPELELFGSTAVRDLIRTSYGLELGDFETGLAGVHHHDWCKRLAAQVQQTEAALVSEMARAYAKSLPETDASTLRDLLREASRQ